MPRSPLRVLLLALAALAVFLPALGNGFVDFDDPDYVVRNPVVREGLTLHGVRWALTATAADNWHPLTWLSHMLDVTLFGLDPRAHHLVSLLLHAANTVLLYLALAGLTGAARPAAAGALLFAVHPAHTESVAWVAERKDLLSACFWLLALLAWRRHLARPGAKRLVPAVILFALALAAKPMAITFPLVLLILDWWPLGRWGEGGASRRIGLLTEKIPLFLLSSAAAAVTILVQRGGGTGAMLPPLPAAVRASNALVSLAAYVRTAFVPVGLAHFYPHPMAIHPAPVLLGAALGIAAVTAAALRMRQRRPALLAGWLLFLVMLLPVLGLVQVGGQARADRYLYLPLAGLLLAVAWGLGRLPPRFRFLPPALLSAAAVTFSLLAARQTGFWRDTESLNQRALAVTRGNWMALHATGTSLQAAGRHREAGQRFREAVRLLPTHWPARMALGVSLAAEGREEEALQTFRETARLRPGLAEAHQSVAAILFNRGRYGEAEEHLRRSLAADPAFHPARRLLAESLLYQGRIDEALEEYDRLVIGNPEYAGLDSPLASVRAMKRGLTDR